MDVTENISDRIDPAKIASRISSSAAVLPTTAEATHRESADRRTFSQRLHEPLLDLPEAGSALLDQLADARPYQLPTFEDELAGAELVSQMSAGDADVEVQLELGRAMLPTGEEGVLRDGAVIPLDKLAGDPVDILVEGRVIARGEVLVLNDKLCVRIAEIIGLPLAVEARSAAFA